jgi:hypothetical protein
VSTAAIMQPTYLPWSGYFQLMAQADVFVLLDDVQFNRTSWQCRNRILLHGAEHMLTVPVTGASLGTPINEVRLMPRPWAVKQWATLQAAYGKTPHGPEMLALLAPVYAQAAEFSLLVDWNQALIAVLAKALGIDTPLLRSSTLGREGQRSARLLALCEHLGASDYLSPRGSMAYLTEDDFAGNGRITLHYQDYTPPPYAQRKADGFVSHLSVVDVIAQQGTDFARRYVRGQIAPADTTPPHPI